VKATTNMNNPRNSLLRALWRKGIIWKLAQIMGRLWHRIDFRHRRIVMHNLELAFGEELTKSEREAICRKTFIHLACVLLEFPCLVAIDVDNVDRFMTFSGSDNLYAAANKGTGILAFTAHFGNWELMALAFSLRFWPFHVVVRPLDNDILNRVVDGVRSRGGNRTIPKSDSVRTVLRLLRQHKSVALLIDQNVDWYEGVFVPFFNEVACTSKALATLALRMGLPVLPIFNFQHSDGRYETVFEAEVQLIRTGDSLIADIEENTALFNRIIEGYIRKHPEQYFWLHQRWKTRPYEPWPR
jgi:Kdo2-lipid IVA lauroyltransferase/acyltransferase